MILRDLLKWQEKKTGKDSKKGKATLISLLGYKNAIKYRDKIKSKIIKDLKKYGSKTQIVLMKH